MSAIESAISLKDNFSRPAQSVQSSFKKMKSSMQETTDAFRKAEGASGKLGVALKAISKTHKVKGEAVGWNKIEDKVKTTEKAINKLSGKNYKFNVTAKISNSDIKAAQKEARTLEKELKKMTGKKHVIDIDMGDGQKVNGKGLVKDSSDGKGGLMAGLGGGIKAGVAGTALAGGAALVGGAVGMVKGGLELEQQKVSMEHWLGGDKKAADGYMKQLRTEANKTPFETGEVVSAGTRAIGIAGGDTKKAMDLVKLSQDMSALTPGKSLSDSMEAIADAQSGEFERLKEFGFKVTQEDLKAAGGDWTKIKNKDTGKTVGETFGGGAEKLSQTTGGKFSTVMGNVKSGMSDAGLKILDAVSPALGKLIPISEQIGEKLPGVIEGVIGFIGPAFGQVKTFLEPLIPPLQNLASTALPVFKDVMGSIASFVQESVVPVIQTVVGIIADTVIPVITTIATVAGPILATAFEMLSTFIGGIVVPIFSTLAKFIGDNVVPVITIFAEWIGDKINSVLGWLNDKLGSFSDAVVTVTDKVKGFIDGLSNIGGWVADKLGIGENANGTNHWSGGLTMINERGGEIADLPNGTRIYPHATTKAILEREASKDGGRDNVEMNITIHVNGANKTGPDVGREIARELRKLRVNMA
ncbi:hypothetical protein EUAN_12350 [Andreesenia angusta]|uniref:Uncharacterized protein n=1 Tax=Andreesenia angusta TaxID=39480 RepID=A0A1S1V6A0_9FIRM|nr:hypothetical protein [Andreesenia angusta]OHW62166.1 hypothetical protein EUAN_12350 [Andreesenia angusta]